MVFTDIFIRRPVLSIVVSLLILFIGTRSFFDLPVRQYPKLENTTITITTNYPGASPELMQGFITTPIEQAVSSSEGIDFMTSTSVQGASLIIAYIKLNYDANAAMTDVMAKVNQVRYLLPREAFDPIIVKQAGDPTSVMYMGFGSTELSSAAISDYLTRVVQPLLVTVPGVAAANILGGQTFSMRLWLDPARMAARGITAEDIALAIRANNFQTAPGQAKGYFTLTNITANTDLTSVEQFRKMVVKARGDSLVRVEDIGTVELGAQSSNSSVSMNSEHAVFIGINGTPDSNPLDLVQGIRALLPELQRNLPPALTMSIPYDSTDFIRASINEVIRSLALAVGIVVVVIFLFLGTFRSVLIPIVTIPLSLVGAMTIMLAMGFSINLLTLLAMVLAIGLVVDDAIVVVENVHRWIEHGKTPVQAAMIGAREIVGPIIAMTITLAAVYAPIGLLGGLTGTLFREFAFTLAGSVIISGIIALTLSPMMCSMLLAPEAAEGRFARFINRTLSAITRAYGRRLHATLNYRPLVAIFGVVILGIVAFEYINSRAELAPPEDQGILFAVTKAPQYVNLDYMDRYADKVDQVFQSFPESTSRFILNGIGFGTASVHQGIAGMLLKPWEERTTSAMALLPKVQRKVAETIDGLQVFIFNRPPLPGSSPGLPVQMVISSPVGYETIYRLMQEIKDKARKSGLFLVTDADLDFNQPVIRLKVDRSKANDLGITMQAIGDSLAVLVGENYINLFSLNGRSYEVIPQVPRVNRLTADKLLDFYVTTATGQSVPLATVVTAETGTDANALTQYNQLNSATLGFVPAPGVTMGTAVDYLDHVAEDTLPKGFQHDFLGESRQYVQEGNQLTFTLIFALIVIYLVLAAQFESLRDPLIILVSVPMAISGALLPVFMGFVPGLGPITLNIYTKVGLVTLIGLIAKHGILMVEFANTMQVRENVDRRTAIEHAAAVRLRPILMTTAAMVVGLIPLLLATGAGAASRMSMGVVIVFGMTIGTLFTLFVLPTVYTVLAKDHRAAASSKRASDIAEVMAGE